MAETKGWSEREEVDNHDEDNDGGEDMEGRYRKQPVRPGIGNLLNPTEEKVDQDGGAARGMFDDYDDDDDY